VYLRGSIVVLANEVECLQFAEAGEKLLDLLLVQVRRQATNEDLVDRVRDVRRDHTRDMDSWHGLVSSVVLRSADLEGSVDEDDSVQINGGRGIVGTPELYR
jgi:hypothetical protein